MICGGVESITVTMKVQDCELPASSVAVTVMVCVPTPNNVPAAGLWLNVNELSQLSEAVTLDNTLGATA